jgi:prepilin-type N-terminal cleavage/methylation domain-containing protein
MNWMKRSRAGFSRARRGKGAFTLVELLVVIGIMALLATLVASLATGAGKKKVRARATGLIAELSTAIDGYKDKMGFYPPHPKDYKRPPLYYCLKGTQRILNDPSDPANVKEFKPVEGKGLDPTTIKNVFDLGGFVNFVPEGQKPKDFYPNLKESNVAEENGVKYIVIPYKGPNGEFNPVFYDASSDKRHNRDSYDIWVEVTIGRETAVIGNWRD